MHHFHLWAPMPKKVSVKLDDTVRRCGPDRPTATGQPASKTRTTAATTPFSSTTTPLPTPIHAALVSHRCPRPVPPLRPEGVQVERWALAGPASHRRDHLRVAHRHLHPCRHLRWRHRAPAVSLQLGITHVEIMPVAEFAGDRGWGYDGVDLFAVTSTTAGPTPSSASSTPATSTHRRHPGRRLQPLRPGRQLHRKFGPYITDKHNTPWGDAINFEDEALTKFAASSSTTP